MIPDAIAYPGSRWRVIDEGAGMQERERHLGDTFCADPNDGGWVALCAGRCNLLDCSNIIDYVETTGAFGAPTCASFDTPIDVSSATNTDSILRTAFDGDVDGVASDWTLGTQSRD